jgi:hypothetical protein
LYIEEHGTLTLSKFKPGRDCTQYNSDFAVSIDVYTSFEFDRLMSSNVCAVNAEVAIAVLTSYYVFASTNHSRVGAKGSYLLSRN